MADKNSVLIIDNNDSFTFNLVQIVEESDSGMHYVVNSEHLDPQIVSAFSKVLISPGPGLPSDYPRMIEAIKRYEQEKDILGICLGHQAIATIYGGSLMNMNQVKHGVTGLLHILTTDEVLFNDVMEGTAVGLYHSWTVDPQTLPGCLEITAMGEGKAILAIRHRKFRIRGLQFHPESYMTPLGRKILTNWLTSE